MKDEAFLKKLGGNIKKVRKAKGITQVELGHRCDFEKTTVSRIEAGRTNPTALTLKKIAEALHVQITELLAFDMK